MTLGFGKGLPGEPYATASYRRRKVSCVERSVQFYTLRPKVQDEGPVYGA